MRANHSCRTSPSQWQTSDWAVSSMNRENAAVLPPPPLIPGSINPSSRQVLVQPPSGLSCKAPRQCELIRFAVQGDVGTDGRGGNCKEICREQCATLQMERVGVLYGKQRGGREVGGESLVTEIYAWIYNAHSHFLSIALCFHVVSTPAHVLPLYCLCIFNHTWMYIR